MIEKYLWIAGSSIYVFLGTIHLLYTFFTDKFSARDSNTEEMMKNSFPLLTRRTTIWNAWVGFNASHSTGAVFFGIINLFFAVRHFNILTGSVLLLLFIVMVSLFYLFLSFKYWFNVPRNGILISSACFITAVIIILMR
jgi:hypothetical protein